MFFLRSMMTSRPSGVHMPMSPLYSQPSAVVVVVAVIVVVVVVVVAVEEGTSG
jgi:hypothetical protein